MKKTHKNGEVLQEYDFAKVCVVNTHGVMLAELISSFWSQISQSYFPIQRP